MFSSIQQILRKSGIDHLEDHQRLLKMTQLVPQIASIEPDSKLQVIQQIIIYYIAKII